MQKALTSPNPLLSQHLGEERAIGLVGIHFKMFCSDR
jgi:hypothetical protein